LFNAIEQRINKDAERGVGYSGEDFVGPTPGHLQADEDAGDKEIDELVYYIEEDGEQKTGAGIFSVDFNAERGGAKSDHRF